MRLVPFLLILIVMITQLSISGPARLVQVPRIGDVPTILMCIVKKMVVKMILSVWLMTLTAGVTKYAC